MLESEEPKTASGTGAEWWARGSKHRTLNWEATPGQTVAYSLELPAVTLPVHSKFQQAWWITSSLWERALVEGRHKKSTHYFL